MKKTTAKKAHKGLIVFVACVLAAALSVGITLAYLTAQTTKVTNTFTASGDISGNIQEPGFPSSGTVTYTPGDVVDKDPLVQNTSNVPMYVAVRLDYYISFTSAGTYYRVPYTLFENYFGVNYANTTSSGNWEEITGSITSKASTPAAISAAGAKWSRYYFYKTQLTANNTSTAQTATTDYANNVSLGYFSQPVFTTVTPSGDILLGSTTNATNTTYEGKLYYNKTSGSPNYKGKKYPKMDFKIIITGFGTDVEDAGSAKTDLIALLNATDIDTLSGSTDITASLIGDLT